MARPRKAPEDRSTAQMGVRFTARERAMIEELAVRLRLRSGADVIRRAVVELYAREDADADRLASIEARLAALEDKVGAASGDASSL